MVSELDRASQGVGAVSAETPLRAEYSGVSELLDLLVAVAEELSLDFERWEERYVSGPSLYFVVVADVDLGAYADPLGANEWPVETCRVATDSPEDLLDAAQEVAFHRDGAVVVAADGTVQEQMVRVRSPGPGEVRGDDAVDSADWMGTKHLSAAEASVREEVLAAVTVSEENGRVTVFRGGDYRDLEREELGGRWRPDR
jgi:hypothetical protein